MNEGAIPAAHAESRKGGMALLLIVTWIVTSLILWGFAFWPVTETSPEWLARTQYVCFGSRPNGLPDTFGWMLLFGGPFMLLISLFVTFGREIREEFHQAIQIPKWKIALFVLFLAWVAEGSWVIRRVLNAVQASNVSFAPDDSGRLPENYPILNQSVPEFSLVDQSGTKISNQDLKGKVTFLTFAFAHCDTVCPLLLKNSLSALEKLPKTETSALFITLDPWRDTPSSLPSMAKNWEMPANAHLLSGSVEEVNQTLDKLNVSRERNLKTGEVVHPALIYILDREGKISYAFNNPSVDWLVDGAQRTLKR